MNAVYIPEGVKNEADVRRVLLNEFNLEIGAGLGPLAGKIWRFGLMGYSAQSANVMLCLSALGSVLADLGLPVRVGEAEAAAHQSYATQHAAAALQARQKATKKSK
jgi:alanine-glyoxylate transaminase/serine-glyoxylate transaminase/serine-pyruvate transaminase